MEISHSWYPLHALKDDRKQEEKVERLSPSCTTTRVSPGVLFSLTPLYLTFFRALGKCHLAQASKFCLSKTFN